MALGHVKSILEYEGEWRTPSHKLVAVVVAFHCDRKGTCRMTQVELAAHCVLSAQRVRDIMDDLCDGEILIRLGHGRYGIRYGFDRGNEMPTAKGAEAERIRLNEIKTPDQLIVFTKDGWPILEDNDEFMSKHPSWRES